MASKGIAKKFFACPVHASIALDPIEVNIVDTPAFQRLRRVKQLGLVDYVYPGADYSRFSHSLGVCHLLGRVLSQLDPEGKHSDALELRLAALLHDVGHYPFSHATEYAVKDFYQSQLLRDAKTSTQEPAKAKQAPAASASALETSIASPAPQEYLAPKNFYSHVELGETLIGSDPSIGVVLKAAGIEPKTIVDHIHGRSGSLRDRLVSSDLDVDRTDYMLRTAKFTGLPYGHVDLNYLFQQLREDADGNICIDERALRAADHFLLCRFFDYQQVEFHKTVVGFELLLRSAVSRLLHRGMIDLSATNLKKMIEDGTWNTFDDAFLLSLIRSLATDKDEPESSRAMWDCVVSRKPPALVVAIEYLGDYDEPGRKTFASQCQLMDLTKSAVIEKLGLPEDCWVTWKYPMKLTAAPSHIENAEDINQGKRENDLEEVVRILPKRERKSVLIINRIDSFMRVLSKQALYMRRDYFVCPSDCKDPKSLRDEIRTMFVERAGKTLPYRF